MTQKPLLILDQHFRQLEELFRPQTYDALSRICRIEGGQNWPMDPAKVDDLIGEAAFYVAAFPQLSADQVGRAENLRGDRGCGSE